MCIRDSGEAATRAEAATARPRVLGMQLDHDLHRAATDGLDGRDEFHQLPLTHRHVEVDLLGARRHNRPPREPRGRDERGLVHPGKGLSAEQRAEMTGMVGEHDLPQSRLCLLYTSRCV